MLLNQFLQTLYREIIIRWFKYYIEPIFIFYNTDTADLSCALVNLLKDGNDLIMERNLNFNYNSFLASLLVQVLDDCWMCLN